MSARDGRPFPPDFRSRDGAARYHPDTILSTARDAGIVCDRDTADERAHRDPEVGWFPRPMTENTKEGRLE